MSALMRSAPLRRPANDPVSIDSEPQPTARPAGPAVAVVGAGIIGLTTAIRLADAGFRAIVLSRDDVARTASANAGAIWGPFLSTIDPRLDAWSYRTLDVLREEALVAGSGVELVDGIGAERPGEPNDWWTASFTGARPERPDTLPAGFSRGWSYTVPIIDMSVYLGYLRRLLSDRGVPVVLGEVTDIRSLPQSRIVIAAGLGSRDLLGDPLLAGAKGQLVVVQNPGIDRFFVERGDGPDLTYILPQGERVGGTAEWDFEDPDAAESVSHAILARCGTIEPLLRESRVLETRVGLRPCRASVCVEREVRDTGQTVYMNYGHGGSGVSLSWGCAESIVDLALADR
jgi:D-amino-acid oxidase